MHVIPEGFPYTSGGTVVSVDWVTDYSDIREEIADAAEEAMIEWFKENP